MARFLFPALLAVAVGAAAGSAHAQQPTSAAQASQTGTLLSVSAQGESKRVPDVATLSTGVVTQAADSSAAMQANAQQMNRVMAAIREAGIAERDVRTSGISISPRYRHTENEAPQINGYEARNTVNVTVRDISKLGQVMDVLVASGANQIHGPQFEIGEPEEAYNEARRAALEIAQARAALYADTLDLQVRRIVSISEGGGFMPPPMRMMAARAMDSAESTPVSPGESTLSVNLDVVFELGR